MKNTQCNCGASLEELYGIYFCPKCNACQSCSSELIGALYHRIHKKRSTILSSQHDLLGKSFWEKFQPISSIAERIAKEDKSTINIATKQMQEDICKFLLMCKEIDERYP